MIDRIGIKQRGKAMFLRIFWPCVLLYLVYGVITGVNSSMYIGNDTWRVSVGGLFSLFIGSVVNVGACWAFLRVSRGMDAGVGDMIGQSFTGYGRKLGGMFLMSLWIALWSCLFVIPGIYKAIRYSLTPYILAEYPDVSASDALKISNRATEGHAGDIFVFGLSYIGWLILGAVTLGFGLLFYVGPYYKTSEATLYDEIMRGALERGIISQDELGASIIAE